MSTCYSGRIIHGRIIVHLIVTVTIVLTLIAGCGTAEPTATPMPPTATLAPPTPAPTQTPVPPTQTPMPPTATLAPPIPAPTQTPIPPTDTPVPSTATPAPPTATPTVLPPLSGSGGGVIAFSSERDGNSEIYVMNADGSDQRRLTYDSADDFHPSWSPDGSQLVFYSHRTGNADIFVMTVPDGTAADGGEPGARDLRQLTDDPANDYYPAWSPDGAPGGDQIVFDSDRDGNHEIYVMDADGGNQRRLTNTPGDEYFAAWSPDGTEIAFISDRDGNQEVYVMDADGSNQRRLTNNPANELEPDWSPDGTQIAFVSNRGGDRLEVYVMAVPDGTDADGSDPKRLAVNTSSENHHSPDWSPDGTRIVFAAKRDVYMINVADAPQDTTSSDWLRLTQNSTQYEHFTTWRPSTVAPGPGSRAVLKTYGGERNDYLYDILLLADGGTLLAGQANNRGLSHRIMPGNAHLIRTDSEGDVIWEKDYAEEVDAMFYSLVQVGEDEYVVLGQIAASYSRDETDLYLVKIDGEGNEIWSHTYGGRGMDDAKMVRQTTDGGFVLAGAQADEYPTDGGYQADVFLVKTDAEGNEVWSQTYGDTILDVAWGVAQTPDGGYVLTGWEAKTYNDRVVIAIKTDEMGEVEWSRSWNLDPGDRDGGYDLILTSDGYIVIACVQSMDSGRRGAVLVKVDLDGNEIWVKVFGDENVGNEFWDIMEDVDGGYVMAGSMLPGKVSTTREDIRQGLIIKTDPDGEVLWQHVFGGDEYDQLSFSSAVVLPDGGYIFVGRVVRKDERYADMLWLKLTADDGVEGTFPGAQDQEPAMISLDTAAQVEQLHTIDGHTDRVYGLDFSADGNLLASGSHDGTIRLWDVPTRQEIGSVNHQGEWQVFFAPDDAHVASAIGTVLQVATGEVVYTLEAHDRFVTFSPDGAWMASAGFNSPIEIWDVETWQVVQTLEGHTDRVFGMAFSPDGGLLATGSGLGPTDVSEFTVKVWDVESGQEVHVLSGHRGDIHAVAFSPDGALLASGSTDETVKVWDVQSGELLHTLRQGNGLYDVTFSPDGTLLASAGAGRTVKLWDVATGRSLRTLRHDDEVMAVAFSPDGSLLASGGYDHVVYLWGIPVPPTETSAPTAAHTECAGLIPESTKAQVRQYVDQGLNAGIVVGIVAPCGREVYAYGETALSGGQAVDENTVFEIGSIGKTFTTLLLADMVERNEVSLDDPIEQFLPDSVTVPTYNGQSITLIDLATHSSGLPAIPDNLAPADEYNPYADYTVEQMYEALAQIELTDDIGARYQYSNLGMGLLGHALSLQSGMSYEELVVARIADALGMPDMRVTLTPGMQDRLATGYREEEPFPLWDNPTLAGAGALRSTVQDMLTFLAANVGLPESRLYEAMQVTHESHYLVNESLRVGLAWHIRTQGDLQIVEHHGATGGYWSFAGFVKDKQTGVVVLTNTFHDVDEIGLDLLRASEGKTGD